MTPKELMHPMPRRRTVQCVGWKLWPWLRYGIRQDISLSLAGSYTSLNEENVYYCPVEFRWWDPQHEPSGAEPEMTGGGSYNSLWHEPAGAKPCDDGERWDLYITGPGGAT